VSAEGAGGAVPPSAEAEGPVTATVAVRVRVGHEARYEPILEGLINAARRFPGHLGVEVFRPQSAAAGEYRTVYRFDTAQHLREWLDSDVRAGWLQRAAVHVDGPARAGYVTGLETWFTLPNQPGLPSPPPYKMALLTWITIFPLITAIVLTTRGLLTPLPAVVQLAVTTAVAVPLMTWVVMPRVTRLCRGWLYPATRQRSDSLVDSPRKGISRR
jgi:antibiotic biosynthesis monooxygenase (ABM) superfamily enzyme